MVLLGVASAVFLVAYGLVASGGGVVTDPVFWLLAVAFLVYVGWDTRRHLRAIRSRPPQDDGRER